MVVDEAMMNQERIRCSVACIACRRSRRRCNGERPCSNCVERNDVCEYTVPKKRGPAPRSMNSKSSVVPPSSSSQTGIPPLPRKSSTTTKPKVRKIIPHGNDDHAHNYSKAERIQNKAYPDSVYIPSEYGSVPKRMKNYSEVVPSIISPTLQGGEIIPPTDRLVHNYPLTNISHSNPNLKSTDSPNIIGSVLYPQYAVSRPLSLPILGPSNSSGGTLNDIVLTSSPREPRSSLNTGSSSIMMMQKSPALVPVLSPTITSKSHFVSPKITPNTEWLITPPSSSSFLDLAKMASTDYSSLPSSVNGNVESTTTFANSSNPHPISSVSTITKSNNEILTMINNKQPVSLPSTTTTPSHLSLPPPPTILVRDESNVSNSGLWSPDLEF